MSRQKRVVTIQLPEEFIEQCNYDMVCPALVLRGFIADLCGIMSWASDPRGDGYSSNGSDEREFAMRYYERVGYPYEAQWLRENIGQGKAPCSQATNSNCRCRKRAKKVGSIADRDRVNLVNISEPAPVEYPMHR